MRLDYVQMNDAEDLDVIETELKRDVRDPVSVILSGALWVDKTRLIDNILLDTKSITG